MTRVIEASRIVKREKAVKPARRKELSDDERASMAERRRLRQARLRGELAGASEAEAAEVPEEVAENAVEPELTSVAAEAALAASADAASAIPAMESVGDQLAGEVAEAAPQDASAEPVREGVPVAPAPEAPPA